MLTFVKRSWHPQIAGFEVTGFVFVFGDHPLLHPFAVKKLVHLLRIQVMPDVTFFGQRGCELVDRVRMLLGMRVRAYLGIGSHLTQDREEHVLVLVHGRGRRV